VLTFGVVASLVVAAATWWRRIAGLLLVLAALPWALHHPSTPRTMVLAGMVGALQVAYLLRVAVNRRRGQTLQAGSSLLMWVTGVWGVAGLLSLFNLPWASMMVTVREYYAAVPGRTWRDVWVAWWTIPEDFPHFSVVAALLTVQAALLAWMVWREVRQSSSVGAQIAVAQVIGLCVALGFGLAEAAGADLTPLRGNSMIHHISGSIQSLAGNRGWLSQYLTYVMPYTLVLFLWLPLTAARLAVGTVTAATVVGLVFAFQRGGWVVGAVLLAALAVVVAAGPLESATRSRFILRRVGIMVTAVAILALLMGAAVRILMPRVTVEDAAVEIGDVTLPFGKYLARIQEEKALGGREKYWPVAWEMWKMHPLIGSGIEGFAYQYAAEVEAPTGRLHGQHDPVPLAASSHNIYLQTAVGTGALGLLALLGMFGLGLRAMVRTVTGEAVGADRRMVALAAGGSLLAIMVYGLVQEVTYIHALRLMLCCAVGLLAGCDSAAERRG